MRHGKKLLSILLALVMVLALLPSAAFAAEDGEKTITILGTSDIHGNIWGYSYENMKESSKDGMARLYTYIQQVRAENPNTILVDAGDTIQGTIMTDDLCNKTPDEPHPVMAAMDFMGYDAMTLGNHEFNWGIETMQKITSQAGFPVLAANAKDAEGKLVTGKGWTIVETGGVKVAIIGVTNPFIATWDGGKQGIDECAYEDPSETVKAAIAEIGDQADVIMVSAHMGLDAEKDTENGTDSGKKILEVNPEVDVLQLGHAHTTVNEKIGETAVGAVGNLGKEIVRFDLTLDKDNNVVASTCEVVSMEGVAPSQEIRDIPLVAEKQKETESFVNDNVLGSTTVKFQPENEIAGMPEGRLQDTAVMDLINKIQLEASGADVSAAALFSDASDLPQGDILYSDIFGIYKFDNTLYRVTVTGAELKAYMEWASACWNTWEEGDINISFNPEMPGYLHDVFAGVDYEVDLSQPAGSRIKNVMFKGEPLRDDQELKLAVNNYRFPSALKGKIVANDKEWESSESIRSLIVGYFAEHSPVAPQVDNNWKIVGVDLQKEDPRRQEIIDLVNEGRLDAPKTKSYNLKDYDAIMASVDNLEVDGKSFHCETAVSSGLGDTVYYRLRDVAYACKGTDAAFNVEWNGQVVITLGGEYTADALAPLAEGAVIDYANLTVLVDGEEVEISTLNIADNNYVSAETVAALLGVDAVEADGVLTITAAAEEKAA